MEIIKPPIDGLLVINPKIFGDDRGYFFESWNEESFVKNGLDLDFVQDNQSYSSKGVLRGLHYQCGENAQAKLVRVIKGEVLDVAVDIRPNSKTYGQYIAVELTAENQKQLFIPRGFAHGFLVLSNTAIVSYKVDNNYAPVHDAGIRWNDPTLNIQWRVNEREVLVSEKDVKLPFFSEFETPFTN